MFRNKIIVPYKSAVAISSDRLSLDSVLRELKELKQAVINLDLENVIEEISDVAFTITKYLRDRKFPICILGYKSYKKWFDRMEIWKVIYFQHQIPFDPNDFECGNNYNKESKYYNVLSNASSRLGRNIKPIKFSKITNLIKFHEEN